MPNRDATLKAADKPQFACKPQICEILSYNGLNPKVQAKPMAITPATEL